MIGIFGAACCCGTAPTCNVQPICANGRYFAEYISVGRPRAPRRYPGRYWAAWHNGISKRGSITASITLNIVKRTLVSTDCGGGTCPAPTGIPTSATCTDSGSLAGSAGCQKTLYVDNYRWSVVDDLPLRGVSPDQSAGAIDPGTGLQDIDSVPGHLPAGIQGTCGSYADANAGTAFGTNPSWFAKENRKVLPRFVNATASISKSAVPSTTYTQTARCGNLVVTNRCTASTTSSSGSCCIDYPMVLLPGYPGLLCDGSTYVGCSSDIPELGGTEVLYGFDILNDDLVNALTTMGLADGQGIGTWNVFWACKTNGRFRLLFDATRLMPSDGDVFRPSDTMIENGIATVTVGNVTWRVEATISIAQNDWCYYDPDCGCRQSWCEFGPSTLLYTLTYPVQQDNPCGSFGNFDLRLAVGLEGISRNPGAWNSCHMWNNLPPSTTIAGEPAYIKDENRYLGAEPVERDHPGWRRYRDRYNHVETLNGWYTRSTIDVDPGICQPVSRNGESVLVNLTQWYLDSATSPYLVPDYAQCQADCVAFGCGAVSTCCDCKNATSTPITSGCFDVRANYTGSCPGSVCGTCVETCSNCRTYSNPTGCNNGCFSLRLPTPGEVVCQAHHSCETYDPNFYHTQIFRICGGAAWNVCDIAPGSLVVVFDPGFEWIFKDWSPKAACSPIGTWPVAMSRNANFICGGPQNWYDDGTLVVS